MTKEDILSNIPRKSADGKIPWYLDPNINPHDGNLKKISIEPQLLPERQIKQVKTTYLDISDPENIVQRTIVTDPITARRLKAMTEAAQKALANSGE